MPNFKVGNKVLYHGRYNRYTGVVAAQRVRLMEVQCLVYDDDYFSCAWLAESSLEFVEDCSEEQLLTHRAPEIRNIELTRRNFVAHMELMNTYRRTMYGD